MRAAYGCWDAPPWSAPATSLAIVSAATLEPQPHRCRKARLLPPSILLLVPATRFTGSSVTCRRRNISALDRSIVLEHGDFLASLDRRDLPAGHALIVFVAPPWGTALDEVAGLDLRRTEPPITGIIGRIARRYPDRRILFAIQVYEKVEAASLAELERSLDWSRLLVYDFNVSGRNHGILLGTKGWKPD
jgi:hypothetical protein